MSAGDLAGNRPAGDMGPPPQPSDSHPRRSNRVAAQMTASFAAVVIENQSSHSSSSLSSRKRKRSDYAQSYTTSSAISAGSSSAATAFSVATKNAIIALCEDKCWHCGSEDYLQCAHIIARRSKTVTAATSPPKVRGTPKLTVV